MNKFKIVIIICFMIVLQNVGNSQTIDIAFNKINTFYKLNSEGTKCKDLRLNKTEKVLEICGINIPLNDVKILYNLVQKNIM